MRHSTRQLFASVLILFMLNTLSWSVGAAAFADWVASEQGSASADDNGSNAPDTGLPDNCGKHCNEGCHVFTHLQGLVQSVPVHHPSLDFSVISGFLKLPGDRSSEELFRPPRSSAPV